ncbi:MAG: hypothetical protein IKX31_00010 [Muribaculaceae bacterium]|nr:hypothetical protein [Muribaculaceae bacterium]
MKRKNILWGFAILIVAMICCWACSSCGDDNGKDEPSNPLLGAWEYEKNPAVIAQLEQMIIMKLQNDGALAQESAQILQRVKDIISTSEFVVLLKEDGEARLYAYGEKGLGVFVSGTWVMTDSALLLQVKDLTLPVTNINYDGTTLSCTIGELPLSFKRYTKNN